jgi:hypothetical protein
MYAQLCRALEEHSSTTAPRCFDEWDLSDSMELSGGETETCVCGKTGLRTVFTVTNNITSKSLHPIGSKCIEHFAGGGGGNDDDEPVDQERLADLRQQMSDLTARNTCHYPGCENTCHTDFCKTHVAGCRAQGNSKCPFKKHKGKPWSEVVATDPGYARWVTDTITGYDHATFGDKNRRQNGYLLAQLAKVM